MPELPEVESLARFLAERAAGRRIDRVELVSFAALKTVTPPSALVGRLVSGCQRRGKFLALETRVPEPRTLEPPDVTVAAGPGGGGPEPLPGVPVASGPGGAGGPRFLALHLARAGWVRWVEPRAGATTDRPAARAAPRSGPLALRVRFAGGAGFDVTEAGTQKRLAVYVVDSLEDVEGIARLGIDPLDPSFTPRRLRELLAGRAGQLKHVLSDQSVIAGIGNAYSDEALHAARFSPFKPAGNLTGDEVDRLHAAVVGVLRDALARSAGRPADELKDEKRAGMRVHGRTGLPCPVCGDTVREVAFADRSLQYCPTCQTGGHPLADRRFSRFLK